MILSTNGAPSVYKHHQEAINNLITVFKGAPGIVACILGGSVAKGLARPDSDIDAIVIVTDEKHASLAAERRLSECIFESCPYEGGYFDIKYTTKGYLLEVKARGSEPARNAFAGAMVLFSGDGEIDEIVLRLGVFQRNEKEEKMRSFYCTLALNQGYFWNLSQDNTYLRMRTAADILLYGYRLLLEYNEVLFPCHKSLTATVERLRAKPDAIVEKGERLLRTLSDEAKKDFVDAVLGFINYTPPPWSEVLTQYIDDNEQWWYKNRPVLSEW